MYNHISELAILSDVEEAFTKAVIRILAQRFIPEPDLRKIIDFAFCVESVNPITRRQFGSGKVQAKVEELERDVLRDLHLQKEG